jgi:hypothetical protein
MGKNQSASNLTNIIQQDASGNISFMSGSTMLMSLSNTGQVSGSAPAMSAVTASYADNFLVKGNLTAQTLVVQTITSSVDFVTGSTRFGSLLTNTHVFTGSVTMNPGGLFVSSSGAVGIGLTNPSNKLEVQAGDIKINANVSSTASLYFGITGTNYGKIQYNDSNQSMFITTVGSGFSGYDLNLGTKDNIRLSILGSNGNVGIGTTTPSFTLDVNGSGRFISPSTFGSSTSNGDLTIISNGSPFAIRGRGDYDRPFLGLSWDTSPDTGVIYGSVLKFNTNTNWGTNAGTTALTILANGKVGIGETSPDNSYQGLTIKGTDPSLRIKTTSVSGWVWTEYVNSSGVNNFSMGVNQTAPYFGIKAGAGMDNVHFLMNSSGNIGMGEGANSIARLNVNGSTKINRSFYNWYQGYWTGNSTYWHMKTSMWGGGSPNGNTMYTMSLFKGYMYSYGDSAVREGMYGFHNWVGTIYNPGASGNLFSNVYVSSDGYVVLVIPSGSGEAGVTIDWHQAYAYPFVNAQVTAAGLHGSTTGKY